MAILVVGAGLAGCVMAERIAAELGEEVRVIDRRDHIAGNTYDYLDPSGILVHKYGPHAFHTRNKAVWDYLSCFTEWHLYDHRVQAHVEGAPVVIPFSLKTIGQAFPDGLAEELQRELIAAYGYGTEVPLATLKAAGDKDLRFLAGYVLEHIISGYTIKQWGISEDELDPSVLNRIPIRVSMDDRYHRDPYQGLPLQGYTAMVQRMLDQPKIKVELGVDFKDVDRGGFQRIIYTGMVDEYFQFRHGQLPYRSLTFETRAVDQPYFQGCSQINYPNNYDFTRIIEYKHMTGQRADNSRIFLEYPGAYTPGENEPFYPIPSNETARQYALYQADAEREEAVVFLGRLAEYRYLNMDQVVENALGVFDELFAR